MRSIKRLGAALAATALAFSYLVLGSGALTASASPDIVGRVYVNDNTAGVNTVAGFAQHANGSLTPLPGSPYAVGGAGLGVSNGSQGALQISDDGRFLLAVDAGSNQISVVRIHSDGSLTPVAGSPVSSGGVEPVSIAVHGRLVYVANADDAGASYVGFTLSGTGTLTQLPNSTFLLPAGSQPGDVLFNGTGTRLIGARVGTSVIDSFVVGNDGHLTPAPGSPFAAQAEGPFGSAFLPTNPSRLYVSNAHAGAGNGSISAFRDTRDGTLVSIGSSPYPDFQTAPCWVDIAPDGRHLFTVNTGSSTVTSYTINPDGTLGLGNTTAFKSGASVGAFDLRISPDGRFAYVVLSRANQVAAFAVHGGTLTEIASSPATLPTGATAFGVVVQSLD
jgi:6-phosphogluconolactonase